MRKILSPVLWLLAAWAVPTQAALTIGNNPLYLVSAKANVLMVLDNSNSMDEAPGGQAVGSASPESKSEIARGVIRTMTDTYRNRVNMGLMGYRLNTPQSSFLHRSPYDVSFNPAHYNPGWTGTRASATNKRFRMVNPSSTAEFIYYNVDLPFYASSSLGRAFCYSSTADASNDFINMGTGWDNYRCFSNKTGPSNTLPNSGASETANGWTGFLFSSTFSPTDSDYAQGITDFGRFLTWTPVSQTWFRNDSPGRGFLHVPLRDLNTSQAADIKAKLACNIPGTPAGCTTSGMQNAGLTPIEGTLYTALDYYNGGWSNADEGYTASCYPLPTSCGKNFVVLLTDGLPSTNKDGVTVSDPVAAINAAATAAAALKAKGIETYVIGFSLPFGVDPATLNKIAASGGTDTAYNATDSASLTAAFDAIFTDIFKKSSAFGSVSQNSTSINTGSLIFQGRFDSTDWSGEIVALKPEADGTMTTVWSTSDAGRIPAAADRKVFTRTGSGGVELKLASLLSTTQQTALATPNCSATLVGALCAQARVNWLRGDQSLEDPAGPLRKRTRKFGDVISSAPTYVKSSNTLFVGANDGMLHAIDAATGNELFTYVPAALISKLPALMVTNYVHDYFVDGEIAVSTTFETPGKNILVGTLGRGGKAVYALDVTSPSTFNASKVMWEFTDSDLGLALGKPVIVKLNNGRAAVMLGNGPNSSNERAVLFLIDLLDGTLIRKLDTQAGSASANNGLSTPRGWDLDGNGTVDIAWAGDLLGNVWRFDLTANTASSWGFSYTTGGTVPAPMFVAKDSSDNRQPITGMIGAGVNARKGDPNFGKRFIFLGTGRYITNSDVTDKSVQSWYGLIDDGTAIAGRSSLRARSIVLEGTISDSPTRAFEAATAGDMAGRRGWVLDLKSPTDGALGERMTGEHKFFGNVLLASSMIPSTDVCTPGGTGFVNALDPFTGGALGNLFFDVNNDLAFTDADKLSPGTTGEKKNVGSISPKINLPSDGILIGNRLISSGTSGEVRSLSVRNPVRNGRIAWREIVNR